MSSGLILSRRRFITGVGLALAAPAIVRVDSLMQLPRLKTGASFMAGAHSSEWGHGEADEPIAADAYTAAWTELQRDIQKIIQDNYLLPLRVLE